MKALLYISLVFILLPHHGKANESATITSQIVAAVEQKNIITESELAALKSMPNSDSNNELSIKTLNTGKIPPSILVAIAIIESNQWKSEKHIELNNPYGLTCNSKCSIGNNTSDLSAYKSIEESTNALFDFINSTESQLTDFKLFRQERSGTRTKTSALMYTTYLNRINPKIKNYSYKLRRTIYINKLQKLDYEE